MIAKRRLLRTSKKGVRRHKCEHRSLHRTVTSQSNYFSQNVEILRKWYCWAGSCIENNSLSILHVSKVSILSCVKSINTYFHVSKVSILTFMYQKYQYLLSCIRSINTFMYQKYQYFLCIESINSLSIKSIHTFQITILFEMSVDSQKYCYFKGYDTFQVLILKLCWYLWYFRSNDTRNISKVR